jgi:hypothetical protein
MMCWFSFNIKWQGMGCDNFPRLWSKQYCHAYLISTTLLLLKRLPVHSNFYTRQLIADPSSSYHILNFFQNCLLTVTEVLFWYRVMTVWKYFSTLYTILHVALYTQQHISETLTSSGITLYFFHLSSHSGT